MRVIPPDMGTKWDDLNAWQQAQLIAYNQIRGYEESQS